MKNLYLGVNKFGAPTIFFEFDEKDTFDKFGTEIKTGFSKVLQKGEEEHYLLIKNFGCKTDYHITISTESQLVTVKVTFDKLKGVALMGSCKKNQGFNQFIEAINNENKSNIWLKLILSGTQSTKLFYTMAFSDNEFATIHKIM